MVYLIGGAAVVAVISLLTSFYAVWALKTYARGASKDDPSGLRHWLEDIEGQLTKQSRTLADVTEQMPVIRAEVAEALTRVDSRFNAARAAEERTRRIARNAPDEEDEGSGLSEEEFLALAASQEPEEADSSQLSWPDLERLAFERRHQRRR